MKTKNINSIEAKEKDYLYTKSSQLPNSGTGLYSAIDIFKDEIIAFYKGELISDLEAKNRAKIGNDKYFINLTDGNIMDSMHTACFAKYANDALGYSNSDFKNNSIISLTDDQKVCIVAKRFIKSGEELFCSYGKKYWKKHR